MLNMDWKQLFAMVGPAVNQELNKLPPEARQSLRETEVYITQDSDSIHLDLRFNEKNPKSKESRDTLSKSLMSAIPEVVKVFGCRAFVKIDKYEE